MSSTCSGVRVQRELKTKLWIPNRYEFLCYRNSIKTESTPVPIYTFISGQTEVMGYKPLSLLLGTDGGVC